MSSRKTSTISNSTGDSSKGSKSVSKGKKEGKKKYKFHPDYLDGGGKENKPKSTTGKSKYKTADFKHPHLHNDAYWEKRYKLINYRKRYPADFKEEECEALYEWLCDLKLDDSSAAKSFEVLFNTNDKPIPSVK